MTEDYGVNSSSTLRSGSNQLGRTFTKKKTLKDFFTGGTSRQDEGEWKVGGRYEVLQNASLYGNQMIEGSPVSYIRAKEAVMMLEVVDGYQSRLGCPVAFVLPPESRAAGWMRLQGDHVDPKKGPLWRQRLEGSWEMRARYRVKHPATLREGEDLKSAFVAEVSPDSEVLVLQIGVFRGGDPESLRLRLKVSTDAGQIGWLSPQTVKGDRLLDPVNLLGRDMLRIHQNSVRNNTVTAGIIKRLSESHGLNPSQVSLDRLPWEVGGHYRVLERVPMRTMSDLNSKQVCKIPAGEIVSVAEMANVVCPHLGKCPCALVCVLSGKLQGRQGWVRCAAKDGRDLIDVRDQLEFEKVQAKIKNAARQEQERKDRAEADRKARAEQERLAKESRAASAASIARPGSPDHDAEVYIEGLEEEESEEETDTSDAEDYQATEDESEEHENEPHEKGLPGPPGRPPATALDGMKEPKMPMGAQQLAPDVKKPEKDPEKEREWAKKLQDLEVGGGKEEKLVDDTTAIQEDKHWCGCNCGGPQAEARAGRK